VTDAEISAKLLRFVRLAIVNDGRQVALPELHTANASFLRLKLN